MNIIDGLKVNSTIKNTKGSEYYERTYNYNLDLFTMLTRQTEESKVIDMFNNALIENQELALANLLYLLDIRNGKGERRLFKIIFKHLCNTNKELSLIILNHIKDLGRYDYILEGIDTLIDEEVVLLIKETLNNDKVSNTSSLLAKWLPSVRTHDKNNILAKKIIKKLNMSEKTYRKLLSTLRSKINIVEKNLTEGNYIKIDFEKVPSKAMLKYRYAFENRMYDDYIEYLKDVSIGKKSIKTSNLYSYEIIREVYRERNVHNRYPSTLDLMWKNQKDILKGINKNILVMADTSGSMTCNKAIPLFNSLGLAIYIAERNTGIFKDHFITFSETPKLVEITGNTIIDKVSSFIPEIATTNIDKVFDLLLDTITKYNISKEEIPSHIIIISDMEFDEGVDSKSGTNFENWKRKFKEKGVELPKIIFWNVAARTNGVPITKFDNDVCEISGFSTNVLENLLTIENITPMNIMHEKLTPYIKLLNS